MGISLGLLFLKFNQLLESGVCFFFFFLPFCLATNWGSFYTKKKPVFDPWIGKIPWRREWQPILYSCLENSNDRGTLRATDHGVAKTGLSDWHARVKFSLSSVISVIELIQWIFLFWIFYFSVLNFHLIFFFLISSISFLRFSSVLLVSRKFIIAFLRILMKLP